MGSQNCIYVNTENIFKTWILSNFETGEGWSTSLQVAGMSLVEINPPLWARHHGLYQQPQHYHQRHSVGRRDSYPCQICGKTFADSTARLNHKKAEHEKQTHSCACGKKYKYRTGLRMHKKICPLAGQL